MQDQVRYAHIGKQTIEKHIFYEAVLERSKVATCKNQDFAYCRMLVSEKKCWKKITKNFSRVSLDLPLSVKQFLDNMRTQ